MSIYIPSFNAFKILETPLSNTVAREMQRNTKGEEVWGNVVYPCVLLLTPVAIVADMVAGVVQIIFDTFKQELDSERLLKMCEQHFFIYPFQQLTFFVCSVFGSLYHRNYVDGYLVGQHYVSSLSQYVVNGPAEIFNRIHYPLQEFQPFPNYHIDQNDRMALNSFKEAGAKFLMAMDRRNTLPRFPDPAASVSRLYKAQSAYEFFCDTPPQSLTVVTEAVKKMGQQVKQCDTLTSDEKNALLDFITTAEYAIQTFFQLSDPVRQRLLSDNPA